MILFQFQVYSLMVRQSNALQSALLAPYKVTTISLTISPVLYCTSCIYYLTTHLYFLITSSFSPILYSSRWYTISICPVTGSVNLDKGGFFKFLHSKVTFSFVINKSLLLR